MHPANLIPASESSLYSFRQDPYISKILSYNKTPVHAGSKHYRIRQNPAGGVSTITRFAFQLFYDLCDFPVPSDLLRDDRLFVPAMTQSRILTADFYLLCRSLPGQDFIRPFRTRIQLHRPANSRFSSPHRAEVPNSLSFSNLSARLQARWSFLPRQRHW